MTLTDDGQPADPRLQAVVDAMPMESCYRASDKDGRHYRILGYSLLEDGTVTLEIVHGRDSTLPGVSAFGIPPDELAPCGCGKWESPTEDQIADTAQKIAAIGELRKKGIGDVH